VIIQGALRATVFLALCFGLFACFDTSLLFYFGSVLFGTFVLTLKTKHHF